MTGGQHGFFYYNWGNLLSLIGLIVSLVGLMFTISALRAAVSARTAAEQARSAARFWSQSDDVRRGEALCRDLASLLSSRAFESSMLRIRDLFELLRVMVELWEFEEDVNSKQLLLECRDYAETTFKTLRKISANPQTSSARDADTCVNATDQIYDRLLRIRAALDRRRNS